MSSSPEFHPEFGYFCPTPQFRRIIRVACRATGFGVALGALAVLALMPRHDPDQPRTTAATTAAPIEDAAATVGARVPATILREPPPPIPAPAPATPAAQANPPPAAAAPAAANAGKACKEATWPYFDSNCLWGPPAQRPARAQAPDPPVEAAPPPPAAETGNAAKAAAAAKKKRDAAAAQSRARKRDKAREAREEPEPRNAFASPYGFSGHPIHRESSRRDWNGWSW
jgi:hypothetical protein